MNQPDRYERFVLPEGAKKAVYARDTKLDSAGTFTLQREDHTLGNLVRMQLLSDKSVMFAGYRIPHPLEYKLVVRVQTTGTKPPHMAFEQALGDLQSEVAELKSKFILEMHRMNDQNGTGAAGMDYQ